MKIGLAQSSTCPECGADDHSTSSLQLRPPLSHISTFSFLPLGSAAAGAASRPTLTERTVATTTNHQRICQTCWPFTHQGSSRICQLALLPSSPLKVSWHYFPFIIQWTGLRLTLQNSSNEKLKCSSSPHLFENWNYFHFHQCG